MSPNFEAFIARLYVEAAARRRFLADPPREAAAAGLTDVEIAAAVRIDRVGLELAAVTFAQKRRRRRRHGPVMGAALSYWRRLVKRPFSG